MGTCPGQGFGARIHRGTVRRVVLRLVAEAAHLPVGVRVGEVGQTVAAHALRELAHLLHKSWVAGVSVLAAWGQRAALLRRGAELRIVLVDSPLRMAERKPSVRSRIRKVGHVVGPHALRVQHPRVLLVHRHRVRAGRSRYIASARAGDPRAGVPSAPANRSTSTGPMATSARGLRPAARNDGQLILVVIVRTPGAFSARSGPADRRVRWVPATLALLGRLRCVCWVRETTPPLQGSRAPRLRRPHSGESRLVQKPLNAAHHATDPAARYGGRGQTLSPGLRAAHAARHAATASGRERSQRPQGRRRGRPLPPEPRTTFFSCFSCWSFLPFLRCYAACAHLFAITTVLLLTYAFHSLGLEARDTSIPRRHSVSRHAPQRDT